MKKSTLLLLLFLSFIYEFGFSQVQINAPSKWVNDLSYNKDFTVDSDNISQGMLTLLYEEQINISTQEIFTKLAHKVTENVGTQPASNINVSFDPTYQKLTFHSINIIRNGKVINKLTKDSFQTIRRELSAETYIYDGSLSAITNLSDVRINDIVEYSYTLKGFNPIHNKHFATVFNLRTSSPIGKLYIEINSKEPLFFKYFETNLKVKESKKGNTHTYVFEETNIKAFEYEDQTPSWNIESGLLNVSNYTSWKQVVDWGVNVFKYNEKLSPELIKKINEIKNSYKTEGERIKATLDFVQDEVRYLGLESGIGAYKPSSPNKIYNQLFGDCKDKSMLLVAMLREMKIKAYPVLINTYLKGSIKKFLPSPYQFNHCVAKVITKEGGEYWYDPTISNQGGNYNHTIFPDYRVGLVLKEGNSSLTDIFPFHSNYTEVTDNFILEEVGKGATLNIHSVYMDGEADNMRALYKNNSISSIKKEYENYYSSYFDNIKSLKNPEFKDDIVNNKFTVNESYKIDSIWKPAIVDDKMIASFYPYTVLDILTLPKKAARKEPYAMVYPATRNHVINITLPENWDVELQNFSVNSPNLYYTFDASYLPKDRLLTLNHSIQIQKDHVTPEEFPEFYKDMKKLDANIGYSLIYPKNGTINTSTSMSSNFSSFFLQFIGILVFLGTISITIWLALKLYKYDPAPVIESYYKKDVAMNGWLIFIGIILCITPLSIVFSLLENSIYINGKWMFYFDSTNSNPFLGIILFIETIFNAAILVIQPLNIVLFFKRRSSFPKVYAITLISYFTFSILDYLIVSNFTSLPSTTVNSYMARLLLMFIYNGLVAFYLFSSDSVKEVFVKRLHDHD